MRKIDNCIDRTLDLRRRGNLLKNLLGASEVNEPRIMFVAINPPDSNPTIKENHECERLAFAGDRKFWRMLIESDLLKVDDDLSQKINSVDAKSSPSFINELIGALERNGYFLTDIVKCPTKGGKKPPPNAVENCKKILSDEIKFINPKIICTLGKLPFKVITGERGNLRDYVNEMAEYGGLKIFPCYFPTGRCPIKDEVKISHFKNLKELCEN